MNAQSEDLAELSESARRPFPASTRIWVGGSRPDLRVPMREIHLAGDNPPITVYDPSGPYTDPGSKH